MTFMDTFKRLLASKDEPSAENSGQSSSAETQDQPWQRFQSWGAGPFAPPMTQQNNVNDGQTGDTTASKETVKGKRKQRRVAKPAPQQRPSAPRPFQLPPGNRNGIGSYGQPGLPRAPMVDEWGIPLQRRQPMPRRATGFQAPSQMTGHPPQPRMLPGAPRRPGIPGNRRDRRLREPWF